MNRNKFDYENLTPEEKENLISFYKQKRDDINSRKITSHIEQKIYDREYLDTLYHLELLGVEI